MRILLITDWNRGRGGAEAYIALLRDGLKSAGHEVRLLTSSAGTAGDGTAEYVAFGSDSLASRAFLQIANPFAVVALRRAMKEFRPDIVVVNMFAHQLSPAILRATGNIPIVLMVSDYKCVCPIGSKLLRDGTICTSPPGWVCCSSGCVSFPHWVRDQPRYALIRSGVSRAARVLACSEYVRRELALSGIKSDCVYLPIQAPSPMYDRSRSATPQILFSGRLDREKGVDCLLRAFSRSLSENSRARLRIAGQGPERTSLESLARELGITERVDFLGWLEPAMIERELASAWALAAPSLWAEPLGLVALEAVSRGVPVIASAIGGFSETLEEGVTGMLVPNGDIFALSTAMSAVIAGRAFPDGVSEEAARQVIERHDIGRHIKRMESIFEDVVNAKQYVVLVDANDQTVGVEEKLLAHEKGLLHRAVSVFILDHSNRLLMQQRALTKYHSPGLWSNTCCGHPEVGELPLDAAKRRLAQEMNITCGLERLGGFMYRADVGDDLIEHEYDHVFLGYYDSDPEVADEEVEAFAWVTLDQLTSDISANPGRYTKWFPQALSFLTSQGHWVASQ